MNEDKLLHCLLNHKGIKSEAEQSIMTTLAKNNISSGEVEKDHLLERGSLVESHYQIENSLGGIYSNRQISVSSLGETEIKRLWDKSELNAKVKLKKHCAWILKKIILPFLGLLAAAIVGYIFQKLLPPIGT